MSVNSTTSESTGGTEPGSLSPISPSSPHLPDGRRRRTAAFSYSRVQETKLASRRRANKHSTSSLAASGSSGDVPVAVLNGTNGHLSHSSLSEDGSSSPGNTSSSVESGAATENGERRGEGDELDAGGGVMDYEFVEEIPSECRCGLCGKVKLLCCRSSANMCGGTEFLLFVCVL